MTITPLDDWVHTKTGRRGRRLSRVDIENHQLLALRETIRHASLKSSFYARHLGGMSDTDLRELDDLSRFPLTTPEHLRRNPLSFLCVSQSSIGRVVTLGTSGTSGEPKRIFFTDDDLESTVDFFAQGMSALTNSGDRVLILLPGERPGSVGDLLVQSLRRIGAQGIVHGPVGDARSTLVVMDRERTDVLVGIPAQVLALVRESSGKPGPRGVLLSTDYVPAAIVNELQQIWDCEVFTHYGMTEMGYGGGVECRAHRGYHMREADLYFEIVHTETGRPLPEGQTGEVVFTTLARVGMPLIRYRTGDLSRFLPGSCPCGTVLKTMERVNGRLDGRVRLSGGSILTIGELDEALFPIDEIIDFRATLTREEGKDLLHIELGVKNTGERTTGGRAREALRKLPAIGFAELRGDLALKVAADRFRAGLIGSAAKRTIIDKRNQGSVT